MGTCNACNKIITRITQYYTKLHDLHAITITHVTQGLFSVCDFEASSSVCWQWRALNLYRSEREPLTGDLAGQWQPHMYLAEGAKRTIARATRSNKNSNPMSEIGRIRTLIYAVTTAERSHLAIGTFLDENKSLHRVYIH